MIMQNTKIVPHTEKEAIFGKYTHYIYSSEHKYTQKLKYKQYNVYIYADSFIAYRKFYDIQRLNSILNKSLYKNNAIIKLTHKNSIFIDKISTIKHGLNLSKPAIRSLLIENAGGKSAVSEMMSIEYYIRIFSAIDILLEMEVDYTFNYKMVDYICTIGNRRVGVSVTRAMGYPDSTYFTYQKALYLLHKKLYGLIVARNSVSKKHRFFKSVLHVWCQSNRIAYLVKKAYESFDINDYGLNIKGIVLLHLTICSDRYIYDNNMRGII